MTPYQFSGPYDIVLARPESFKVGHFKANIKIKLTTLKLSGRVKTMSYGPKNWYAVTFWVKLNGGVWLQNPQKISAALLTSDHTSRGRVVPSNQRNILICL